MEGNNLQIRPLFDNVVVKKDELEEKSKTGIIITGSDDQPALVGTVLTVGRDVEDQIKPGDKIMYAPFSGRELGGFLLLAQHDIMGVVEEDIFETGETLKVPDRKTDQILISKARNISEWAYRQARSQGKTHQQCVQESNKAWDNFWNTKENSEVKVGVDFGAKKKCNNCGTEGRPEENQPCPNCSKIDWKKI